MTDENQNPAKPNPRLTERRVTFAGAQWLPHLTAQEGQQKAEAAGLRYEGAPSIEGRLVIVPAFGAEGYAVIPWDAPAGAEDPAVLMPEHGQLILKLKGLTGAYVSVEYVGKETIKSGPQAGKKACTYRVRYDDSTIKRDARVPERRPRRDGAGGGAADDGDLPF